MVRKARVWFDEELAWTPDGDEEDGAVAVQTQTGVLNQLSEGEPLPNALTSDWEGGSDADPSEAPVPKPRRQTTERRHLAGANWTDDWTLYLPTNPPKPLK